MNNHWTEGIGSLGVKDGSWFAELMEGFDVEDAVLGAHVSLFVWKGVLGRERVRRDGGFFF